MYNTATVLHVLLCTLLLCCCSDQSSNSSKASDPKASKSEKSVNIQPTFEGYLIAADKDFLGLEAGESVIDYANVLRAASHTTQGGMPSLYSIVDNDKNIGFVYPTQKDPKLIGEIQITAINAMTTAGIKMGLKLSAFRRVFDDLPSTTIDVKNRMCSITKDGLRYSFRSKQPIEDLDQAVIDEISYLVSITILP